MTVAFLTECDGSRRWSLLLLLRPIVVSTPARRHLGGLRGRLSRTCKGLNSLLMVAVGTRISPRPPHRSRRALLTHRAPPSGQTSCNERSSVARRPTRSHHSGRRGISAQCPNRGRLTAVPLG